ncbi:ABC transporter permease [Virgibacillus siamensis]|uniref:ABC transporter permease n=1 Tax=Virgibacillus siamensis TaxID=480071 RepID=A0ABP3RAE6_9BACI
MIKTLFKHPLFLTGFLFITILISASIVHAVFFDGKIPVDRQHYNEQGELIAKSPFSPIEVPPLGTDQVGNHLFFKLLQGAKYTIGIALIVAMLRMIFSFIMGLFYGNFALKLGRYVSGIVNSYYFVPISLLCYVLLSDVLLIRNPYDEIEYTFVQRAGFEFIILTIVALPTTSLLIGEQMNRIMKNEFVVGEKTLGGSRLHIFKRHILPHLWPRIMIQYAGQIVQVLILLAHLGFFHLMFGGTKVIKSFDMVYVSMSGEWSGMLGNNYYQFLILPWLFLAPVIAFTVTILALNFMVKAMEEVFLGGWIPKRKKDRNNSQTFDTGSDGKELDFSFVKNH